MRIGVVVSKGAALKAGKDVHGPQLVVIPAANIPSELRAYLLQPADPKEFDFVVPRDLDVSEATFETAIAQLEHARKLDEESKVRAEQSRKKNIAEDVQKIAEWLNLTRENSRSWRGGIATPYLNCERVSTVSTQDVSNYQEYVAECKLRSAVINKEDDEYKERSAQAKAEQEAKEAAQQEAKHAQLSEVVQKCGSDTQKARWDEDLMPVSEAITLLDSIESKQLVDTGLRVEDRNTQLGDDDDLEHDEYCEGGTKAIDSEKSTLTDEQYLNLAKVKKAMEGKNATFTILQEELMCKRCECKHVKTVFVKVEWKVGEIEFVKSVCL